MSLNICLNIFLSLSLGFPLYLGAEGEAKYQVVANWPEVPAGYTFGDIPGVAVDSKDRVYFFHRGSVDDVGNSESCWRRRYPF
jgi:hypothetical protein